MKNFKNFIGKEKKIVLKNYDKIVEDVGDLKEILSQQFMKLKLSSQKGFEARLQKIEDWFEEHQQRIIHGIDRQVEFHPLIVYCISAFLCLGFSTIFHICFPISKRINDILQRLDMGGISIMIFGSTYAANYYFYYCRHKLFFTYATFAFVTNFAGFVAMLFDTLHTIKWVWLKGVIFAAIGLINGLSIL